MDKLYRFKAFLKYQWQAQTKYYLHSPFVYQFYLHVLEGDIKSSLNNIHQLRKSLSANQSAVHVTDWGTKQSGIRKVSTLEHVVSVKRKYGRVLYNLVKYFNVQNILELGTCIGISSAYMATANPRAKIVTLEGSKELINIAQNNHSSLQLNNIKILHGDFETSLPDTLNRFTTVGLVLFDGNHQKEATLNYFHQCLAKAGEGSIFVFDDIYWSREMNDAWQKIKQHPQVTLSIDIFQFGICFFKKEKLAKESFTLRY